MELLNNHSRGDVSPGGALIILRSTDVEMKATQIAAFAIPVALSVPLCVFLVYLTVRNMVRNRKVKHEINEWLVDAVKLKAFCEEFGETQLHPFHTLNCVGNVKVTFSYKGDKKILHSNLPANSINGTGRAFTRFVGKEIYIMYFPKYKQVIFLDEPCDQSGEIL